MTVREEVRAGGGRGGDAGYPVLIESGGLDRLPTLLGSYAPAPRYAVISDRTVAGLYGERVLELVHAVAPGTEAELLTFPPGEVEKRRERWAELTDGLLEAGIGRDGVVLALGGGVTGDLAGFVAATYLRGIPVVQIPTSLVAMIDASVGGKTGVDVAAGKNLVGAFHPPRFVLADPALTATLPRRERAQGLAEALKHGAILDEAYFREVTDQASALLDGDPEWTARIVARSVELKSGVVSRDEREEGLREILNFGHTLGHALEARAGYRMPHGSAVALGMGLEAALGEALGVTARGTGARLAEALERLELPSEIPLPFPSRAAEDLVRRTRTDKKGRAGKVRYVLLERIGAVRFDGEWSRPVPDAVVLQLLGDLHARAV